MQKHDQIILDDLKQIAVGLKANIKNVQGATFLVTGPNGLLASYIVDSLAYLNDSGKLKKKCKIIGLQRSGVSKKSRLGHLLGRKDILFIKHNVTKPYKLTGKIDYIIHAAGRSAPATFQSDPLGTVDVNVKGIGWILEYAKNSKHKVKSILYMSSGEIYGSPTPGNIPTPETYTGNVSTMAPRACYTESKRLSETLCSIYHTKFGVPVKIARPFIVYGPGLEFTDRRVMADFMRSGLDKKPIEMLSAGLDTRSYCYITDATILFFRLLFSNYNCEPFNIANNKEEISIKRLAELVHEICEIERPVKVAGSTKAAYNKDAPSRVCPDVSKAARLLNYKPVVGIKEGLKRTIEWNRSKFYGRSVKNTGMPGV